MDIVVVPCDLITDLSFHKLADMHRAKNSSLSLMLSNAITARDIVPPGPKINKKIGMVLNNVKNHTSKI